MGLDAAFWARRKVFLTGHTGFKGSWLCLWLELLGADIVGYSDGVPTDPALFELAGVGESVRGIEGDVRDARRLQEAIGAEEPDILIHMAAQPLVRRSLEDPLETFSTNVLGTANVLETLRSAPSVRVAVVVTSDKCYAPPPPAGRGYREDDPLGGTDPYSSSKACAELVTEAYRASYFANGSRVASVRAGNVIGGGDWARDRLVPDVMNAALARRRVVIRNPDAIRPWQHVLNPLEGYLLLIERLWDDPALARAWNFAGHAEDAVPVGQVLERLAQLWPDGIEWSVAEARDAAEAGMLVLDSSRAQRELGWRPRWNLEQALESVVDWYRVFQSRGDLRQATVSQIRLHQDELVPASP